MWFTFGLAGVVLLIACANLANLQLVRSAARTREHSVRAALGARRFRLLRQSMTESFVLACLGGALSLLVAYGAIAFINRSLFASLPGTAVTLDFTVFGFAFVCSVLTGVVFGTVPAWLASRADVNQALKESPRGATSSSHHRLRYGLIVGEVAFAVILLAGAGLFLRGLQRFESSTTVGARTDCMTGQLGLLGDRYSTPPQRRVFFQQLEQRLLAIPGVQHVAFSNSMPVFSFNSSGNVFIEGRPEPEPGKEPEAFFEQVSLGYFDTLGVRLIAGRLFTSTDAFDRPQVVIINETMARQFWPNESPLGKRLSRTDRMPFEVVGVVSDVSFPGSLAEPYTRLQAYRPLAQAADSVSSTSRCAPRAIQNSSRHRCAVRSPSSIRRSRSTWCAPHKVSSTRDWATSRCSARC